jgi:hypothetical protein
MIQKVLLTLLVITAKLPTDAVGVWSGNWEAVENSQDLTQIGLCARSMVCTASLTK